MEPLETDTDVETRAQQPMQIRVLVLGCELPDRMSPA
jgi:hypothetical protein